MNMMTGPQQGQARPGAIGADEWSARVELAAAHRLVSLFGWTNLIYNHVTLRVPGEPQHFLLKPHTLLFEEVTASSLVKLDLDGNAVGDGTTLNAAGFNIHTAVLKSRPEINCVVHVHTLAGMAISAHAGGLLPLNQGAMRFYNRISYHDYEGLSTDANERERIERDLGRNKAMIMRNHGLLTCGTTVREALILMKYLVMSAEAQLMLEASGAELVIPPPDVCERAAQQWETHDPKAGLAEWPAMLRIVDRHDPSYGS